jgi:uncharacterized coiled-coil DUF342 family protein
MKNFQQNLLLFLALGLCALCVAQWYGQTLQRNEIQRLEKMVDDKSLAIQGYTNSIKTMDHQIAQMDARLTELKAESKTNAQFVVTQKRELNHLRAAAEGFTNEIAQYVTAVQGLQAKLKDAYALVQKQNEEMKTVLAQRDELVGKLNDLMKDRNAIVSKYNDLVSQVQKAQAAAK